MKIQIPEGQPSGLDDAFRAARPGDIIELGDGIHPTSGNWGFGGDRQWCQMSPGVTLLGAGSARTIVRLAPNATRTSEGRVRADRDLNLLWAGAGCRVVGVTFDGNEKAFAAGPDGPAWHVSGLRFHGHFELGDVVVTGLRGSWQDATTVTGSIESFAVSSTGDTGGSVLEGVRIRDVAPSAYVSGIFLGATVPPRAGSLVHNCMVDLGSDNQFEFSANFDTTFSCCEGHGARAGFYNDTGPTRGIVLTDCRLEAKRACITLVAQKPGDERCRFLIRGGIMNGARLVEIIDKTGLGIPADVVVDGVSWLGEYVTAIDNPGNCMVRVQNSVLSPNAVRFRTARSPESATRSNYGPDGQSLPNQLRQVVR